MADVKNVVAPQGTAFTADHARILKRYVDEVVLCFDSDTAGQAAAVRVLDSLLASGLAIRVATVPAPHDPDSFIKERGGAAFQQLIQQAEGFFDFYLNHLCAANDPATDKGRLIIVRSMAEAVLKTGSAVLADTHAQKAAQRLGVSPEAVRAEFKKAARPKSSVADSTEEGSPQTPALRPPPERELWLLRFLLAGDEAVEWVARHLDLNWLQHATVRRIISARLAAHAEQSWRGVPQLLAECAEAEEQSLITQAVAEELPSENLSVKVAETVRLLRNDFLDRQLASLRLRLAQPGLSEPEALGILRQQAELRRAKQQPLG